MYYFRLTFLDFAQCVRAIIHETIFFSKSETVNFSARFHNVHKK